MVKALLLLGLGTITLLCAVVLKTYRGITVKELRRRSRAGDRQAEVLYRAASHGESLRVFLWVLLGVALSLLFYVLERNLKWWAAVPLALAAMLLIFAWLPASRPSRFGWRLSVLTAPVLVRLLGWLQPFNSRLAIALRNRRTIHVHSGLYEKEDLLELLDRQQTQLDNRISEDELRVARGALTFGDKLVRDVMTPRRVMKTVKADDSVGPHLLDELHASGFSRFPVVGNSKDSFVGTLYFRDLTDHPQGGKVRSLMKPQVHYVNEMQPLTKVLDAAIKTHNHLFIVVNNFEEVVGVISLEDVLEQVIGRPIIDEFDQYHDLRAVAAEQAQAERHAHKTVPPEPTEVLE